MERVKDKNYFLKMSADCFGNANSQFKHAINLATMQDDNTQNLQETIKYLRMAATNLSQHLDAQLNYGAGIANGTIFEYDIELTKKCLRLAAVNNQLKAQCKYGFLIANGTVTNESDKELVDKCFKAVSDFDFNVEEIQQQSII